MEKGEGLVPYFRDYVVPRYTRETQETPLGWRVRWALVPECKVCGSPCTFLGVAYGWSVFCSDTCSQRDPDLCADKVEKCQGVLRERYGVTNPLEVPEIKAKAVQSIRRVFKERSKEILEKVRGQIQEKYGVDHYTQTQEYKDRVRETSRKRYGTDHFLQNSQVKEKIQRTNLEKYGVGSTVELPGVVERAMKVTLEKYGRFCTQAHKVRRERFISRALEYQFEHVTVVSVDHEKGVFECKRCKGRFEKASFSLSPTVETAFQPRCMSCYPVKSTRNSLFQQEVVAYLAGLVGEDKLSLNSRKVIGPWEVDIWIPSKKIGVEVSGLFYHSEVHGNKNPGYHLAKTTKCEDQGVHLVTLWEDEWVDSRDIVKDRLRHLLGVRDQEGFVKIYPRSCIIGTPSPQEASAFLQENHLQGLSRGDSERRGLYTTKGVLVALMTLSKPRIALGSSSLEGSWFELSRFAVKQGVGCPGAASKLLKSFSLETGTRVISYADRRWTSRVKPSVYERMGFRLLGSTRPSYWYLLRSEQYKIRHHRFSWRKSVLSKRLEGYDASKTEWDMMREAGHDRIWDCGNLKYEWISS